jgi:Zn-dependent protease with chaperone function
MEHVYPPGPAAVPPNLTAASAAYKRHAWLAMLGLATFIVLYFALSTWFAWTAWRIASGMFGVDGDFDLWGFVAALCSAFLAVFMLKALFFIQHRYEIDDIEVTRDQQPRLFDFIDRLADEARAPRAHKVYLSPRVNAAVFYDLSLLNLIVPSKKNLEIGLGLVNVVTLGELKAVLAHEFGHFAQRSMAVGRWVYIARQIAGHVVARRDALDKLLKQLSRLDLRVAWIGWILSIIVWSIRSMMDVLFRVVLLAERALSRQMEFQADLVAVSLTGSDALIHALHKLNAADDAWDKTLSFASDEAGSKRRVTDLFAVQSRIIERMREILNQPTYGIVPPIPDDARETHRVFKTELAQPPRMWATHPPSADREQNAKSRYVAAPIDERSAWALFDNPQSLRERMSTHVFRDAELVAQTSEETFAHLEKQYGRAFLDRAYRGAYLNRSPVRHVDNVVKLYGVPIPTSEAPRVIASLYPESLARDVELHNEKLEEKHALEALRDDIAQAPGGVIRHGGEEIRRADLPRVIASIESEIAAVRGRIEAHDERCRAAHLAAARSLQKGWPEYLQGLAAMLHYADHSEANLRDVQGYVGNIYGIVTADGRVSSSELARLIEGCQQLYSVLQRVYEEAPQVTLDRTLARRLEVENWMAMLEEFKLPPPDRENIGEWLNVIDGWVNAARFALGRLRDAALEQLLLAESQVAKFAHDGVTAADAPPASVTPKEYRTLLPGHERPRQKRLDWWDRFQTADGAVPTIARSAVALGIVGGVVVVGANVGVAQLTIYNALALPVWVEYGGDKVLAQPDSPVTVSMQTSGKLSVRALTEDDRLIESFDESLNGTRAHYVYNVAGAAPLYEWTATYFPTSEAAAAAAPPIERPIGALRWSRTRVDHVFENPPQSISSSSGQRDVLATASGAPTWRQLELVRDETERAGLIMAHARWDDTNSPRIFEWLELASGQPQFHSVFADRLNESANDVVLLRFEQNNAKGEQHDEVCARHQALASSAPDDPDLQYLVIRCISDEARQGAQFLAAHEKWKDHPWLMAGAAAVHAEYGEYQAALPLYEKARANLRPMQEYLSMETARIRRLVLGRESSLRDLAEASAQLSTHMAMESSEGLEGTALEPYGAIARGDLGTAFGLAKARSEDAPRVLRLVAISDGATTEMIEAALSLQPDEGDFVSALYMYALAARLDRDVSGLGARLSTQAGARIRPVLEFLDALHDGADPARAYPHLDVNLRYPARYAAVVLLGQRAPEAWRTEAANSLFIGERGYLAGT